MAEKHPMALRKGDKKNFETLQAATRDGMVALVSARRKSDGAKVALACAVNRSDGTMELVPLAVMVEGNPYELFEVTEE
mgnify:CR=1 FL=1